MRHVKIADVPYVTTDWSSITPTEHPGTTGMALWRTFETGNLRVRMVDFSAGYMADHWCSRGHVVLVLEGEVVSELSDGTSSVLKPGMSYQVADDAAPHRSCTVAGAKVFIVD
jgi:quercetin dioxygenase-like cupin family protein